MPARFGAVVGPSQQPLRLRAMPLGFAARNALEALRFGHVQSLLIEDRQLGTQRDVYIARVEYAVQLLRVHVCLRATCPRR